jgi:cell division protein FtsQ
VSFLEKNEFWNAQIVQINIREDSKVELVPRVGDAIILLGSFERYEAKLKKLEKLYTKGFNVVGWNKYKVINLEYKDQVVCSRSEFIPHPAVSDSVSIEVKDSIIAKKI